MKYKKQKKQRKNKIIIYENRLKKNNLEINVTCQIRIKYNREQIAKNNPEKEKIEKKKKQIKKNKGKNLQFLLIFFCKENNKKDLQKYHQKF